MTPFQDGGPEIPTAPVDIPIPDTPPADFHIASTLLHQGSKDSGFWQWLLALILDWIPSLLAKIIGFLFGCFGVIVAWILRKFAEVRQSGEFGVNEVAASTISDLFGIDVSSAVFGPGGTLTGRQGVAANVAAAILGSLGAGIPTSGDSTIEPGSAGAEKFLNAVTHLAVEGWLEGFLFELCSAGFIKEFGELKDIMARVLGLGRMAQRVMRPAITAYVTEPFQRQINKTFHPTLLVASEAARAYLRGDLTRPQLDDVLALHGYSADKTDVILDLARVHLSPADLAALVDRGQIEEGEALTELSKVGYDTHSAAALLFLARKSRPEALEREIIAALLSGYAAGKVDQGTVETEINNSGLPDTEKAAYVRLAGVHRQLHIMRPSLAEGVQLVEAGIWGLDQYATLQAYYGLNLDDARDLELLTLSKVKNKSDAAAAKAAADKTRAADAGAKAQAAAAKAAAAKAAAESKGVSISKFESLVKTGVETVDTYRAFLASKGIAADNITALTTALQDTLNKSSQAATIKAANTATLKAKNLSFAQLESAVKAGALTVAEFENRIVAAGVAPDDAQLLGVVLQDGIDAAQTKAAAAAAAKAAGKIKAADLAQFQLGVREGLRTLDDYAAFLSAHGYTTDDVSLLRSELADQIAKDQAAVATKAAVAATAAAKGLDLAQLERAVRAGIKPMADYRAALLKLGYAADAQDALVSLLQLQIDHDAAVKNAVKTATELFKPLGVTLSDVERAVILGVVPLSTLTDALTRAKVNVDESNLITLTVTAEAAKAAATRGKMTAAAQLVSQQGYTLSKLEADTLKGTLSITQLDAILAGAGVAPGDVADITQLVQDEIDNGAAVAALSQTAATRAAVKGLSLAEESAAVKAGVKTIDEYAAFLSALGFDAADVDTLTRTLGHDLKLAGF